MRKIHLVIIFIGLGLLVYLAALLIFFPAQLVVDQLNKNSNIKIQQVTGSVWSGYATSVLTPAGHFNYLSWRTSAWSLLRGKIKTNLELGEKSSQTLHVKTQLQYSLWNGAIQFQDLHLQTNGDWLSLALQIPLALAGNIEAHVENIYWQPHARKGESQLDCQGQIFWQHAGLSHPEPQMFGHYQIDFSSAQPNNCTFALNSLEDSAVPAAGKLQLNADGQYNAQLSIQTGANTPVSLQRWLNWLGPANAQGKRQWHRQGRLADLQYLINGG
ncbi:MAG: type II secretion system protein N [Gammaproteobacteria bacterium]|nr:type II secretion system protein N [Gammaproteobacteria bacterium]